MEQDFPRVQELTLSAAIQATVLPREAWKSGGRQDELSLVRWAPRDDRPITLILRFWKHIWTWKQAAKPERNVTVNKGDTFPLTLLFLGEQKNNLYCFKCWTGVTKSSCFHGEGLSFKNISWISKTMNIALSSLCHFSTSHPWPQPWIYSMTVNRVRLNNASF